MKNIPLVPLYMIILAIMSICLLASCKMLFRGTFRKTARSFDDDLTFLKQHTDIILLKNGDSAVALAPAYQGRVMTSTYDMRKGPSFGWLNRKVIEGGLLAPELRKGALEEHIYVFGGEERFWMGPEGGQFAIFFKPNTKFTFDYWFTPSCIDTDPYQAQSQTEQQAEFYHHATLENWLGTRLEVGISRRIRILDKSDIQKKMGIEIPSSVKLVAYESENSIRNTGQNVWTKESGMLSIWLLGMYPPSKGTTVVIPFKAGPEDDLGPKVNDTYFGKVPADYLKVENDILFFKGDGTHRGKIGINPKRAKGIAASYDEDTGILNIVTYNPPARDNADYVNSMWEIQHDPFSGDVINSYNDGSPAPGKPPLGPFYEIETSSPAANLRPGEELQHVQTTIHMHGPRADIDLIAKNVLGVGLDRIEKAF